MMTASQTIRILGIDPGTARLGYAIVDFDVATKSLTLVNCGIIQTSKDDSDANRLKIIREDLENIINSFQPEYSSVEQLFFFKNPKTIVPVAQARGVILEVCATKDVKVYEYTPLEMKKIITGDGRADKNQVSDIVHREFNLEDKITPDDAVDAVALAMCFSRSPVIARSHVVTTWQPNP